MPEPTEPWADRRDRARLRLLRMHHEARVGHIGGNLSCLDLLLLLHQEVMGPDDRFVLSKGHAAGAYYVALWSTGRIPDEELATFHRDGTRLAGHPAAGAVDEILFATGSLGHGLGLASGLALAKRLKGEPGRVFCLTSDGEWDEGSCWEALIFARQRGLDNLTILVDLNGLQGFGTTAEVADLGDLAAKLRAFAIPTAEVDGHDRDAILGALRAGGPGPGPDALVARTHKGAGISFMVDRLEWHYLPLSGPQYLRAIQEIEAGCAKPSATG